MVSVADDIFTDIATRIGDAWATDCVTALREQKRPVVGAWPGTLREARGRVVMALAGVFDLRDRAELDARARSVYTAARARWARLAEPDDES